MVAKGTRQALEALPPDHLHAAVAQIVYGFEVEWQGGRPFSVREEAGGWRTCSTLPKWSEDDRWARDLREQIARRDLKERFADLLDCLNGAVTDLDEAIWLAVDASARKQCIAAVLACLGAEMFEVITPEEVDNSLRKAGIDPDEAVANFWAQIEGIKKPGGRS